MIDLSKFTSDQKLIRKRICEISFAAGTSHLGSCLSVCDIIDAVYKVKKKNEKFVLSNGHAGFALYAVLEKYGYLKDKDIKKLSIHPNRNFKIGIDVSCGSLGHGLPIAVGIALAARNRRVFCVVSDGECQEGSVWEALRIAKEQRLNNLLVVVNANGWGAYSKINLDDLKKAIIGFGYKTLEVDGHDPGKFLALFAKNRIEQAIIFARTRVDQLPFLSGQDAHYHMMDKDEFQKALKIYG